MRCVNGLLWVLALGGCSVEVDERVRLCTAESPCAEGRACVDGYCVSPAQQLDAPGPCEAAEPTATNIIGNGDFDVDLMGWDGIDAELSRVPSSLPGGFAVRVTMTRSTLGEFELNDSPTWLHDPVADTRYCWAGWIRSESSTSVGQIDLIEYDSGGATLEKQTRQTPLSTGWQRLRIEYVAHGAPGGILDLHARITQPKQLNETFDVDHVALWVAP